MNLKRKMVVLVALSLGLMTLLLARIADVQLLQGLQYRVLADDNRLFSLPVTAERGVLLDRYNSPLVFNTRRYFRMINPQTLHPQLEAVSRDQALAEMATQSGTIINQSERLYRFPQALSHVLGYVGAVTADDLLANNVLKVSDTIGKLGLEYQLDRELRGVDGKDQYEIDARGRRQKKVSTTPAVPGQNVQTTLDPFLSQVAYQVMAQQIGALMILDAETGEVLSLISTPTFDPNVMTKTAATPEAEQQRRQQIQQIFNDPRQLFFNRAVSGQYPSGSVFKLVTALAGLENNKFDASTTVVDEGVLRVGEYEYGNWYFRQYGRTEGVVNVVKALSRSNDIFFYKAAEWVGPDMLASMARIFGFGQPTGIELGQEAKGLVPDPAWKERTLGEQWFLGNTYHMGIGQGDVLVSPVQVGQLVQALAHNGTLCQPSLLKTTTTNCRELGIRPESLDLVLQGMLDACSPGGTSFPFFSHNATRRGGTPREDLAKGAVACKTGTAEFGGADAQGHRKTHGWFVAIKEFNLDQIKQNQLIPTDLSETTETATDSAQPQLSSADLANLRSEWLDQVTAKGFPRRLAFVSLVESTEQNQFQEGSTNASPVILELIEWIEGSAATQPQPSSEVTPSPSPTPSPLPSAR